MRCMQTYQTPVRGGSKKPRKNSIIEQASEITSVIEESNILQLKIQNSALELEKNNDSTCCKNHPQAKGIFFVTGQPWRKLCKECAFNRALCGNPIQRQFSVREFEKKVIIQSLIEDIKVTLGMADTETKLLGNLAEKIDKNYMQNVAKTVKIIDQLIQQINCVREALYLLYEQNISKKINECYKKQDQLLNSTKTLKFSVEQMQNNYSSLISDETVGEQFDHYVDLIRKGCDQTKKIIAYGHTWLQKSTDSDSLMQIFRPKIAELSKTQRILQRVFENLDSHTDMVSKLQIEKTQRIDLSKLPSKQLSKIRQNSQQYASLDENINKNKFLSHRRKSMRCNNADQNISSQSILPHQKRPSLSLRSSSQRQAMKPDQNSAAYETRRRQIMKPLDNEV